MHACIHICIHMSMYLCNDYSQRSLLTAKFLFHRTTQGTQLT